MIPALDVRGVHRDFALGWRGLRRCVLAGADLMVARGEIVGLLGANGSGKSTLLKIAAGLVPPQRGECRVCGTMAGSAAARSVTGFMPEAPYFHGYLTGRELVEFHAALAGLRGLARQCAVTRGLDQVGLSAASGGKVGTYSKGMLQRLALAQALVNRPRLLLLDEPTAGVDAEGVEEMLALIRRVASEGAAVLLTSHDRAHLHAVCDRCVVLTQGRLLTPHAGGPAATDELASARRAVASLTK